MTDRQDTTMRTERVKQALAEAKTLNELAIILRLGGVWATVRTGVAEVWVQDLFEDVRWVLWLDEGGQWLAMDVTGRAADELDDVANSIGAAARWAPVNVGGGT